MKSEIYIKMKFKFLQLHCLWYNCPTSMCVIFNMTGKMRNSVLIYYIYINHNNIWWLVRATYVVDGWFLGDFFWNVEGSSAHTHESCAAHMWQLTCMVNTIWWRGALTCGSHVAINMHGNYYYMVEGSPHVWFTCGN